MGAGDVRQVPGLADGGDEEHGGHALESSEGDDVRGPVHAHGLESDGEGCVDVDLAVGLHEAEGDREDAVGKRGDGHGADEADGDVLGRVLGLLGHGRHGVEADVGEEEDGGGLEDAAGAEVEELVVVGDLGLGKASDDDEEDDGDVDDGGQVVEARGALGAERRDKADDADDDDGDGVEAVVAVGQGGGVDAEVVGLVVEQGGKVGGPGTGHGRATDHVLKQDVAGRDERHEVAELHPEVGEGAT